MRKSEDYTPPSVPASSFSRKGQRGAAEEADKAAEEEENKADKSAEEEDGEDEHEYEDEHEAELRKLR